MNEIEFVEDGHIGDLMRASFTGHSFVIETWNPWSGDTETGFGRGGSTTITMAQALLLAEFLLSHAK